MPFFRFSWFGLCINSSLSETKPQPIHKVKHHNQDNRQENFSKLSYPKKIFFNDLVGKDLVIKDQEEMSELTTEDYCETIEQNVKINEDDNDIIKISVKRQSAFTKDILASISQKTDAMSDENNLKIQISSCT